jgi:protein phosphatase
MGDNMKIGYRSDVGKRGESNEDSILVLRSDAVHESQNVQAALLVVADGVGGYTGGGAASCQITRKVAENVGRIIFEKNRKGISDEDVAHRFQEVIKHVNRKIFDHAKKNPHYSGMSTTVTAAVVLEDTVYIGHVGDSRAYIINGREIRQVTTDHSLVQEMVDRGEIKKEEARIHPKRNIATRVVGFSNDITVDTLTDYIYGDDYLLLCSDGLTDVVTDEEIHDIVTTHDDLQEMCDTLIHRAHGRNNAASTSVIVAQFDELRKRKDVESDKTEIKGYKK